MCFNVTYSSYIMVIEVLFIIFYCQRPMEHFKWSQHLISAHLLLLLLLLLLLGGLFQIELNMVTYKAPYSIL